MMPCVKCNSKTTSVMDSRWRPELAAIWRRRRCEACWHIWTTFEKQEEVAMDLRKLIKLIDEMEGKMAEAVKEFREAVK